MAEITVNRPKPSAKMSAGSVYRARKQYGCNTNRVKDYHAHLSMLSRMTSFHPDMPQYPNVHKAFLNNKVVVEEDEEEEEEEEEEDDEIVVYLNESRGKKHPTPTKPTTKVATSKRREIMGQDWDESFEVFEESFDVEAEEFIQQKRKGLELCKWRSFKN